MATDTADTAEAATDRHGDDPPPLAGTRARRLAANVAIVAILLAVAASTMPDGSVKNGVLTLARPVLGATSLEQGWGVFADPRRETSLLLTRIDRADGPPVLLAPPEAAGPSAYWDYRWRGVLIQLTGPSREAERFAYARWVAIQDAASGHRPTRVSLVRRSAALNPPGPGPDQGPWRESTIFSVSVTP